MTELEKYEMVNAAETVEDIYNCIRALSFDGEIRGRSKVFNSTEMLTGAHLYFEAGLSPNHIKYYNDLNKQS